MWIVAPIPKKNLLVRQNLQTKNWFLHGDFTPFMRQSFWIWDHFFALLSPKDFENLKHLDIGLLKVGAKQCFNYYWTNLFYFYFQFYFFFNFFLLRQFDTLYEQKFVNLRPLLSITFPQGFWKSNQFGHWTSGSGGKRLLNGVKKCDGQTHGQTNKHTNILTYRKNRPRGPTLWK